MRKCKLTYFCLDIQWVCKYSSIYKLQWHWRPNFFIEMFIRHLRCHVHWRCFIVMNGIYLVIASACILILAYRFYGAFIWPRCWHWSVSPNASYGSQWWSRLRANKQMGNIWSSLQRLRAGPLVGPVIAASIRYLPGALWILIGSVLAGAVHDMVILFASFVMMVNPLRILPAKKSVNLLVSVLCLLHYSYWLSPSLVWP